MKLFCARYYYSLAILVVLLRFVKTEPYLDKLDQEEDLASLQEGIKLVQEYLAELKMTFLATVFVHQKSAEDLKYLYDYVRSEEDTIIPEDNRAAEIMNKIRLSMDGLVMELYTFNPNVMIMDIAVIIFYMTMGHDRRNLSDENATKGGIKSARQFIEKYNTLTFKLDDDQHYYLKEVIESVKYSLKLKYNPPKNIQIAATILAGGIAKSEIAKMGNNQLKTALKKIVLEMEFSILDYNLDFKF